MGELDLGFPLLEQAGKDEGSRVEKWRCGRRLWTGMVFMVSLSILMYGITIIKSLRESRPLGCLTVWEKLAYKDGPDWPDESEGLDLMGQGRGGWIDGSRQRIGSTTIGS